MIPGVLWHPPQGYEQGPWPFTVLVREGEEFPSRYGCAYYVPWGRFCYAAPVPLNKLYGWWQVVWAWLVAPTHRGRLRQIDAAYTRGVQDGRAGMFTASEMRAACHRNYRKGREHEYAMIQVQATAYLQEEVQKRVMELKGEVAEIREQWERERGQ